MKYSEIKIITNKTEVERQKWKGFVENHPYGSFFHSPDAYEIYKTLGNPGFLALVDSNDDILGGCIYYIQPFGPPIINRFFNRLLIYGNVLVANNESYLFEQILGALCNYSKNAVYVEIRNLNQNNDFSSFLKHGFSSQLHLNIINKVNGSQNDIYNGFSSSRKRGIKKALKQNFTFNHFDSLTQTEVKEGFELIKNSYKRIKLPIPGIKTFHFINEGINSQSRKFFALFDENKIMQVFLVGFVHKKTFYGYYVGSSSNSDFLNKRPLDLFYWEIIKYLNENGFDYFDWMGAGSPDEDYGVRDFKKQYGGELIETGRFIKINKPVRYWLIFTVFKKLYKLIK